MRRWLLVMALVGCDWSEGNKVIDGAPTQDAPPLPDAGRERCTHHTMHTTSGDYSCTSYNCCLTSTGNLLQLDSCRLGGTYPPCEACQSPTFYEPPCH